MVSKISELSLYGRYYSSVIYINKAAFVKHFVQKFYKYKTDNTFVTHESLRDSLRNHDEAKSKYQILCEIGQNVHRNISNVTGNLWG